ncbi:MAG: nitroreductase family protein [Deltaproteobacteria bacterium]|nr:nitroreductase family protein [Deltaproteobacteria bacterium]
MGHLLDEIGQRRAFRAFNEKKVPEEVIGRIMTAATYAPSCFNNQSWRFLMATEREALDKVRDALSIGNYWMKKAPVLVVVATKPEFGCQMSDHREYAIFDCGLAVENLMLQAFSEGLFAHAVAGYDPLKVKQAFGIPDEFIIITLVAIGYPGDEGHLNEKHKELEHSPRNRKPESEVIAYNRWHFTIDQ